MFGITDTIKNYIIIGLLAALALGGFVYWSHTTYLNAKLTSAEAKVTELEADIVALTNNLAEAKRINGELERTVKKQNAYIEGLIEEEKRRRKAAADALAKAQADGLKWRKLYDDLFASAPSSTDSCQSANVRLNGYLQLRKGEAQ